MLDPEMKAIARQGGLMLRGAVRRPRRIDADRVAVFVHGYLAAGGVFDPMRAHVERTVGVATLDFTYSPLAAFEEVVERFTTHVARHVPEAATLSLVGHSLGGIVCRVYLHERAARGRVDRVVTLATPHAGTLPARYGPGQLEAIRPGSPVLARLRVHRQKSPDVPHVAVIAGEDRSCIPPESAGAVEGAAVHRFDDLGHNAMLFDPRVLALVAESLR